MLPRYQGRLWTLCNPTYPDGGFCLSIEQAKEIRLRIAEDRAHWQRLAIDTVEQGEKSVALAQARQADAEGARAKAVAGAVLGSILALLVGGGLGVAFGAMRY